MAWFEVDEEKRRAVLDLHGYTTTIALVVLETKLQEVWANGLESIEVIHGAPDVPIGKEFLVPAERGSIKSQVHLLLEVRLWDSFVDSYAPQNGSIIIYLKPNLNPQKVQYTALPDAEFGEGKSRRWATYPMQARYSAQQVGQDAEEITNAMTKDIPHQAVQKKANCYIITMSVVIPGSFKRTLSGRRKRLREAIQRIMKRYPQFEETRAGSKMAYRRRNCTLSP